MSEQAREAILRRVRKAVVARHVPYPEGSISASLDPRAVHKRAQDLLTLFLQRQEKLGGAVRLFDHAGGLVAALTRRLGEVATGPVWLERGLQVGRMDLAGALKTSRVADVRLAESLEPGGDWKAILANASVGITGADLLLAGTGSVVLIHRNGRLRMLSLLPAHHFVVASSVALVPDLDSAVPWLDEVFAAGDFPAVTVVTGASRTADIEKILIQGVHGPQNLEVFLLVETE